MQRVYLQVCHGMRYVKLYKYDFILGKKNKRAFFTLLLEEMYLKSL